MDRGTLAQEINRYNAMDNQFNTNNAIMTLRDLPIPVLLVSPTGEIIATNDKADWWLSQQLQICHSTVNQNLCDLLNKSKVTKTIAKCCKKQKQITHSFTFKPNYLKIKLHFTMNVSPSGDNAIITIEDITALKRNDKMRKDFIANISHELRTPLTSIMGFIETLQTSAKNDITAREKFLSIMSEQANHMVTLLDGIMKLSTIESQEQETPTNIVSLDPMIQSVCAGLSIKAQDRAMIINQSIDPNHTVIGHEMDLCRVFENIIENAIKYGRDSGTITIISAFETINDVDYIAVHCHDDGEGIEPKHIHRLTERFYRAEKSRSKTIAGTGLGLAIVKHTLTQHRGLLDIKSNPIDGTTFSIYIPTPEDVS